MSPKGLFFVPIIALLLARAPMTSAQACSCLCPTEYATADSIGTAASATTDELAKPPSAPADVPSISPAVKDEDRLPIHIIFNEIFADPVGDDATAEYFELLNAGSAEAALVGWRAVDGKSRSYSFGDVSVPAGGLAAFHSASTDIPLVNSGGSLYLMRPDASTADGITYGAAPQAGLSWSRQGDATWVWSEPTEEMPNATPPPAAAPIATRPVSAPATESTATAAADSTASSAACRGSTAIDAVRISEILPHPPKGADEWIELRNVSDASADLSGWFLDDAEGGSAPYVLPCGTVLQPNGYALFFKITTRLAMNDDLDEVRLLTPERAIVDLVSFRNPPVGESYALAPDGWRWAAAITPGRENLWPTAIDDAPAPPEPEIVSDGPTPATTDAASTATDGDSGLISGTVTLGTGIIGPHSFVLLTSSGEPLFVRSSDAVLRPGETVEVRGKVRDYGVRRWLQAASLTVGPKKNEVTYATATPGDLDESADGLPYRLSGIVESAAAGSFRISDRESDAVIRIRLPAFGLPTGIKRGAEVTASGIIRWQGKMPELLVESVRQVAVNEKGGAPAATAADAPTVRRDNDAAAVTAPVLPRPLSPQSRNIFWSMLSAAAIIAAGGIVLWWRRKQVEVMEEIQE